MVSLAFYSGLTKYQISAGQVDGDLLATMEDEKGWDDDDTMAKLQGVQARPVGSMIRGKNSIQRIPEGKVEGRYVPGFHYNHTPGNIALAPLPAASGFLFNRTPVIDTRKVTQERRRSVSASGRF